ncbi:BTB/POZ protein [Glomus cerebriforme]|uniref:BTB/POZ protein n=1 Tax=Glomus cerebriforme TaxID=658196 RepID=A0A397SI35_9GLOM|nr:BTB/POZ protein [Glomus cerebriforme]
MMRGHSLEQDLKLLLNNPKYSDVEIICEDKKILYCSRAILAARSEVFDGLLYNGMKESYENQISFPTINSSTMEIILEYIYTGSIREESLTEENIIETFNAADYFQLLNLQDFIVKTFKITLEKSYAENYIPELLSKVVKTTPSAENNVLLNLLVDALATIPLNSIEFGRLSITALQYLLSCTYEKEKSFATPEYEVFRYSAILAAKQVSDDAYETFMEQLPTLDQLRNPIKVDNNFLIDQQSVAEELEPLIKFIDFRRIKGQILATIVEPLKIIPDDVIMDVYRHKKRKLFTGIII